MTRNQDARLILPDEATAALDSESERQVQPPSSIFVTLNLLSNACKFTKEGEVALRVRKVADGRDWVELAVAGPRGRSTAT